MTFPSTILFGSGRAIRRHRRGGKKKKKTPRRKPPPRVTRAASLDQLKLFARLARNIRRRGGILLYLACSEAIHSNFQSIPLNFPRLIVFCRRESCRQRNRQKRNDRRIGRRREA